MTDPDNNPFEQLLPEDVRSLAGNIRIEFSSTGQALVIREAADEGLDRETKPGYSFRVLREA